MEPRHARYALIAGIFMVASAAIVIVVAATTFSNQSNNFLGSSSAQDQDSKDQTNSILPLNMNGNVALAASDNGSLTIVTTTSSGALAGGAEYEIISQPPVSFNYTVTDDGDGDQSGSTAGITTINNLPLGNYTVTQVSAPQGYARDKLSKIVEVADGGNNNSTATATFTSIPSSQVGNQGATGVKSLTYTAKFQCGTIFGDEGPLRPGHYDTDISILNRQNAPISMLWSAVIDDGASSSAIIKTLEPESSTSIVCKDLAKLFDKNNVDFSKQLVEGFVVVQVSAEGMIGSIPAEGSAIIGNFAPELDVQVFYTANALDTLPHSVLVDKIAFSILNDTSGKIPQEMLAKPLDVNVDSSLNTITDTEEKVKEVLAEKYNLSNEELAALKIRIISVNVGVGTMIDDHAISLLRVMPQASG